MHASERSPQSFSATVELEAAGVTLGSDTRLVRFDARTGRLALAADRERCLALLAIAAPGARLDTTTIQHLVAAAAYWERGDKALANLRLVFAGLPRLRDAGDAARLRAAEYLLDHGMTPSELLHELAIDTAGLGLQKEYDPNQPRVPAGQGKESGRWWDGISHWLNEDVPVYDEDTGDEVGTQSRGRAIATNPLTIIGAGAAVLAGAEVAAGALLDTAVEASIAEAEGLLPAGMNRKAFAELAGFAQGLLKSSETSAEATAEVIERLQNAGVTRECVIAVQRFHAGEARRVAQNLSAIQRAKLLSNIAKRLK